MTKTIALLLLFCLSASPALAQAPAAPPPGAPSPAQHSHLPPLDPANPYSAKVTAAASDLAASVTDRQAEKLSMIRSNLGYMGATLIAEHDVSRAVQSCVAANPPMQSGMEAAFRDWRETVGAALGAQQQAMAKAVHSGIAGDPHKVTAYFRLIDQAADWASRKQNYPPPTAAPACQSLMNSMGRTKQVIADSLSQLQWPAPDTAAPDERIVPPAPDSGDAAPADLPHSLPPGKT